MVLLSLPQRSILSLPASSPIWASEKSEPRENAQARGRGFAARSRVLVRLASLAQIGELARRLVYSRNI